MRLRHRCVHHCPGLEREAGEIPGADAFSKRVTHPERGEMTFQTLIETMAGHDINHQRQIESLAVQFGAASAQA